MMNLVKLTILILFCSSIFASEEDKNFQKVESVSIRSEKLTRRTSASMMLSYSSLSNSSGISLSGAGVELDINYAFTAKQACSLGLKQVMTLPSGSTTNLSFKYNFALSGKLYTESEQIFHNDKLVIRKEDTESKALVLQLIATQHYFNTSSVAVPLAGYGLGLFYKIPWKKKYGIILGTSYENVSNQIDVSALTLFSGLEFRI
jgi:hypothetical protein